MLIELSKDEIQDELYQTIRDIDAYCDSWGIKYYMIGGTLLGAIRHGGFIPWDDDIDIAMRRDDYEKFISLWNEKENNNERYFLQNYRCDKTSMHTLTRVMIRNTHIVVNGADNVHPKRSNLFIDIFPLDVVPDNEEARANQRKELLKLKRIYLYKINTSSKSKYKHFMKECLKLLLAPISFTSLAKKYDRIAQKYNGSGGSRICSMSSQYDYNKQAMDESIYGEPIKIAFRDAMLYAPAKTDEYLKTLYGDYMKLPPESKRVFHIKAYRIMDDDE